MLYTKFAIIGSGGFISKRHCEVIEQLGHKVTMTCDIDPSKNADFLDYKEMFKSKKFKNEVDAVVIATPNYCHKQMAIDALATGKKVLIEKPCIVDNDFEGLEGSFHVLQLRYHMLTPDIRKSLLETNNKIDLVMKVYRDDRWWNSWRGDFEHNGNILMSLAIHMFDYLIFLLGNEYEVIESENHRKLCTGIIKFPTALINYHVEVLNSKDGQTRSFIVNGQRFEMCDKENLSFAGYHHLVHRDFIEGNGIPLSEARKAIELVLKL